MALALQPRCRSWGVDMSNLHIFAAVFLALVGCRKIEPAPQSGAFDPGQVYQDYLLKTYAHPATNSLKYVALGTLQYGGSGGLPYYPSRPSLTFNDQAMDLTYDTSRSASVYAYERRGGASDMPSSARFTWSSQSGETFINSIEMDLGLQASNDFSEVSNRVELSFQLSGELARTTAAYAMQAQGVAVPNPQFSCTTDGVLDVTVPVNVLSSFDVGMPLGITIIIENRQDLLQGSSAGGRMIHIHHETLSIPALVE